MIASDKGKAKILCFRGRVPALKKMFSGTVLCFFDEPYYTVLCF